MNTLGVQAQLPSNIFMTSRSVGWFMPAAVCLHLAMLALSGSQGNQPAATASHNSLRVSLVNRPAAAARADAGPPPAAPKLPAKTAARRSFARSSASEPVGIPSSQLSSAEQQQLLLPSPGSAATSAAELSALGGQLSASVAAPADAGNGAATSVNTATAGKTAEPAAAADLLSIQVPPPGLMKMKLLYQSPGKNPVYGIGEIEWGIQQDRYQMRVEASLDLLLTSLRLYRSESRGRLAEHGIAPEQISEARRGRDPSVTQFDYQQGQLQFSASHQSAALQTGAQDRSTVFMQLAGLGLADPNNFRAGREIHIQVAEDRDANLFKFVVSGQEQIDSKLGSIQTWHLIRPARPGFYNSTLELWLAPDYHWYPVQIRNTESNGAVTTQTVSSIQFNTSKEH